MQSLLYKSMGNGCFYGGELFVFIIFSVSCPMGNIWVTSYFYMYYPSLYNDMLKMYFLNIYYEHYHNVCGNEITKELGPLVFKNKYFL